MTPNIYIHTGGIMNIRIIVAAILLAGIVAFAADGDTKEVRGKSKKQGWLGVTIQDVTPKFARAHDLKIKEGAYVNDVVEDSPAESAGVKEGDIIIEFNSKKIEEAEDLMDAVRSTDPGSKVNVVVNRSGEKKTIAVEIGKNKMKRAFVIKNPRAPRIMMNMFSGDMEGMELMELNKQLGKYFDAPNGRGVLVTDVEEGENAAKAGILAGDVITKIGDETIKDVEDVHDAVSDSEEGNTVVVDVLRNGKKMTMKMVISAEKRDENHIFWNGHSPGNFNFQFEPQMDRLHKELEIQMNELSGKQKEFKKLKIKIESKET